MNTPPKLPTHVFFLAGGILISAIGVAAKRYQLAKVCQQSINPDILGMLDFIEVCNLGGSIVLGSSLAAWIARKEDFKRFEREERARNERRQQEQKSWEQMRDRHLRLETRGYSYAKSNNYNDLSGGNERH